MILRELRQTLRTLRRSPGFSAAVVLVLGLGIGANTAIYSVFDAVILRPLPYPAPDRIVMLPGAHQPEEMGEEISPGNFLDWRRQTRSFAQLGVWAPGTLNLMQDGRPERLRAAQVTPGALAAIGTKPLLGRLFLPEEEREDSRLAILSHAFWRSHFAGDPGVVGRTIRLSGLEYPVVGVMPPEFRFPQSDVQLWVPFRFTPARAKDRQSRWIYGVGRLADGVSIGAAQRELDGVTAALAAQFPADNKGWGVRVVGLQEHLVGRVRPALFLLLATVLLVLVVACANIANLQLARAAGRRTEMAVRSAMGASAPALVRQLLLEAMTLSLLGGVAGALLAKASLRALVALAPMGIPGLGTVGIDSRVLAFTAGTSVLTGLFFGLVPALSAWKSDLARDLSRGGRTGGPGGSSRVRRAVTITEVAAALVLLVGATLLLGSLSRLRRVAPGFDPRGVTTMEVVLPPTRYADDARLAAFFRELSERASRLPGVEAAGGTSQLPLSGANSTEGYVVEGQAPEDPNEIPEAAVRTVTPGYFAALRIPVIAGRDFSHRDTAGSARVVVVNRAFARRHWPGADALGKRLRFAGSNGRSDPWEVVGVVGDIHHSRLDAPAVPEIYANYEQGPQDSMVLAVRSGSGGPALAAALRAEVARLDPEQPVFNLRTMDRVLAESTSEARFYTTLLTAFAGLALLLAAVGIYSVIAYSVEQRRHEIGIRAALGAQRVQLLELVVKEGMTLAAFGIAAGLLVAAAVTRGMSGLLYGIRPHDPLVFAGTAMLLFAVALAASLVPALRAARVSPVSALKGS
jgi:putative ABC transport system permease protein